MTLGLLLAIGSLLMLAVVGTIGVSWIVAYRLTHPPKRRIDVNPSDFGLLWDDVCFQSQSDGVPLRGWYIPSLGSSSTVILAHGYRMNRVEKRGFALNFANDLVAAGYNVFMFDFRNSGESGGNLSTVGHWEQRDVHAAIDWVTSRHTGPVFLHGFSMGAATSLHAAADNAAVQAVVADSSFDNLKTYLIANLSRWSRLPKFPFDRVIIWILPLIAKANPNAIAPVHAVSRLEETPILFIHGGSDTAISWHHSKRLHELSSRQSQLWIVPGADHLDAYLTAPEEYARRVINFLRQSTSSQDSLGPAVPLTNA